MSKDRKPMIYFYVWVLFGGINCIHAYFDMKEEEMKKDIDEEGLSDVFNPKFIIKLFYALLFILGPIATLYSIIDIFKR